MAREKKASKKELVRIAHVVEEVLSQRRRMAAEQPQHEERRIAKERAALIVELSRWEAVEAGYSPEFTDELLLRGYDDFQVIELLRDALRLERIV